MNHLGSSLQNSTRPRGRHRVAAALLGLVGGLVALTTATSPADAAAAPTCVAASRTTDWKAASVDASAALAKARTNLARGQYIRAAHHFRVAKNRARTANTAATALIGRPPTDPESDDVSGVAAVIGVNGLDHRITMALVPLFSSPKGHHVVPALGLALDRVDECRSVMLQRVVAQSPAALDDYVDGLSDVVGVYSQELNAMAAQLSATGLTSAGRSAITHAEQVVTATNTDMQRVFGGGERSPSLPR